MMKGALSWGYILVRKFLDNQSLDDSNSTFFLLLFRQASMNLLLARLRKLNPVLLSEHGTLPSCRACEREGNREIENATCNEMNANEDLISLHVKIRRWAWIEFR